MNSSAATALEIYREKVRSGEIERPKQKNPLEKSQEDPKSKAKAIVAMCFDCAYDPADKGSWKDQVRACEITMCPLWAVRPQ